MISAMQLKTMQSMILLLCESILCLSLTLPVSAWLNSSPRIKSTGKQPFRMSSFHVRPYIFLGESNIDPQDKKPLRRLAVEGREDTKIVEKTTDEKIDDRNATLPQTTIKSRETIHQNWQKNSKEESSSYTATGSSTSRENHLQMESPPVKTHIKKNRDASVTLFSSQTNLPIPSTITESMSLMDEGLVVKPIGVVRSIYRLCVGTPRQGLLAPNARGCIDLFTLGNSSPLSSVEGLKGYSHIWVVFIFHLNTQSENKSRRIKSKISPPALGGQKVGIFATRAPHRFNPIGMTLCRLDRIERIDKRNVKLHISGMDLVDGTPVLDIKPYVPVYDSATPRGIVADNVRVPDWVVEGLSSKRSVIVTDSARAELEAILQKNPDALEFYGPGHGEGTVEETITASLECIQQVLMMDVRSTYQTKKWRAGNFKAERSTRLKGSIASKMEGEGEPKLQAEHCTQQLDNLLIHFDVEEHSPKGSASERIGDEETLRITSIKLLVG